MVCALFTTSAAVAQHYSAGTMHTHHAGGHHEYVIEGSPHHGSHGPCCSRGGCCPEDSRCCDACHPHGLNLLFHRIKTHLCKHRCPCRKACCVEHDLGKHCCPQKTCCPHPTSCAPELGPCCDTRRCKKPFFLSRLFKHHCRATCCDPCGVPMRDGCCAPAIDRGDYPFPPVPTVQDEHYESVPERPRASDRPSTEQTSGDKRQNVQKRRPASGSSSRGPI